MNEPNELFIEKEVGLPINDLLDRKRVRIIIDAVIESIDMSKNVDNKKNWTILKYVPYSVEVQKIDEPQQQDKGW